ncbi:P-loop containing nucleoside triphosphate hydrolase protein [Coprinopsis sp. MPI-PUGE-AT-0042]|nr:P-loop containing nucleoside triphosphate hydrolase protein [Coprinopsis sp. MPI-PUGE-AT-0042]
MSEICWGKACNNIGGKQCTICGTAKYCGRDCQVNHWKEHKKECSRLKLKKAIEIGATGNSPNSFLATGPVLIAGTLSAMIARAPIPEVSRLADWRQGSCFCEKKNFGYFYCDRVPKPYHISSRSNIRYSGDRHPENWWDINAKKRPEFFEMISVPTVGQILIRKPSSHIKGALAILISYQITHQTLLLHASDRPLSPFSRVKNEKVPAVCGDNTLRSALPTRFLSFPVFTLEACIRASQRTLASARDVALKSDVSALQLKPNSSRQPLVRFSTFDEEEAFLSATSDISAASAASSKSASSFDDWVESHGPRIFRSHSDPSRLHRPSRSQYTPSKSRDEWDDGKRRVKPEWQPLVEGDPFYAPIERYKEHFLPAIEAEFREQEAVIMNRLSTWTVAQLKAEGWCLTDMFAYWSSTKTYGMPTAVFKLGPGTILPEHKFETGTQVLVSTSSPLLETPKRGAVTGHSATSIRISFQESFPINPNETFRIDLGKSNIVFERMKEAISQFTFNAKVLEDTTPASGTEWAIRGTHLRDVLLEGFVPEEDSLVPGDKPAAQQAILTPTSNGAFADDVRISDWVHRYLQPIPEVKEGDMPLEGLNTSQMKAIASMIGNRISLVQGVGTGKTKTILETIKLLKSHFRIPHPILVCTYTNVAVDNLVEGFVSMNLKPIRVGYPASVRPSLQPYTLQVKMMEHDLYPKCAELRTESDKLVAETTRLGTQIEELERDLRGKKNPRKELRLANMRQANEIKKKRYKTLRLKIYQLELIIYTDLCKDADVICTTCITSVSSSLSGIDFPIVFLDEASMATEPVSLIPLMKGAKHVALIGDHKQLPPVITSREAQTLGLGVSLFERLTKEGVVPSVMLDIQYRMHPEISKFPSDEFYFGSLRDGTVDEEGRVSDKLKPVRSKYLDLNLAKLQDYTDKVMATGASDGVSVEASATVPAEIVGAPSGNQEALSEPNLVPRPTVVFLDHAGDETMKDKSRINRTEGHIITSVVVDLLLSNPTLSGKDIGIIAPYVAQISLLTRLFTTDPTSTARLRDFLGDTLFAQLKDIEIKTVDGFEGREKDVIIFSTVRNNDNGNIGFLADKRRLNVGLTRAKRALFIVGNIKTLQQSKGRESKSSLTSAGEGDDVIAGEKGRGIVKVSKGAESWRRYAEFLRGRGLVVSVDGEVLERILAGEPGVLPGAAKPKTKKATAEAEA